MKILKKYNYEIISAVAVLTLGILSGFISKSSDFLWYKNLNQPFFQPPNYVFGPVWTILYILIGISFGMLWRQREKYKLAIKLLSINLILNFLWTPLFFHFHLIGLALLDLVLIWSTLLYLLINIYRNKLIFLMLIPYFLWTSFALLLNASLFYLN